MREFFVTRRESAAARIHASVVATSRLVIEPLERRTLLSSIGLATGQPAVNLSTTVQAKILGALPKHLKGAFSGSKLHLSPAPIGNQATPQYVLVDPNPQVTAAGQLAPFAAAAPVGLTPAQLRQAYGVNNIKFGSVAGDGTGQTIAIIDAYDDPTAAADLQAFDTQFGLSAPPSFTKVNQTGGSSLPGTDPANGSNWVLEESLDIEWTHVMAPAANIVLVEANSPTAVDLMQNGVGWARQAPGVSAISMSFGDNEMASDPNTSSIFTTPAGHSGITFLAATGDNGKPGIFPAYSPNIVAVGGTSLSVDSSGNYVGESGWSGSGGGSSFFESQPAYQKGVVTQTDQARSIPDVALDADPNTGVAVCDSFDYGSSTPWLQVGGTSLASPLFAGLIAIADQGRALKGAASLDGATQTLPALYALPSSAFHDVTSGNNGYAAGVGYDLVTGLGSPVARSVISALSLSGPAVTGVSPLGVQTTPISSVSFNFNVPMDPTSFSVGSDVQSFQGPGGVDLSSEIIGFNWLNGNKTLQVTVNPQATTGNYTISLGPQILSSYGEAMDQNQNGVDGEAIADRYSASFYYSSAPTQVVSAGLANGMANGVPFTALDFQFSAPYAPSSVSRSNLMLSQGTVTSTQVIDATHLRYFITGTFAGTFNVGLTPGSLFDTTGLPVVGYRAAFFLQSPATPGTPVLIASSDTGVSSSDDVTNLDNSSTSRELQFSVPGTTVGNLVSIYADGILIGSATASSTTTTVTTDGSTALQSGAHSVTARQAFGGQSAESPKLAITILNAGLALPAPGGFDPTFNGNGVNVSTQLSGGFINATAIQPDGKIIAVGGVTTPNSAHTSGAIARFTANGQLDLTFGNGGFVVTPISINDEAGQSVAIQADGKIVMLIGTDISGREPLEVVRYNADGTLDGNFGSGGIDVLTPGFRVVAAGALAIEPDGKIIISATATPDLPELVRLTASGALDTSFNGTGYVQNNLGFTADLRGIAVTSDGHLVVAGIDFAHQTADIFVARYTAAGVLDSSFNGTGYVDTAIPNSFSNGFGIVSQPDGKVLISAFSGTTNYLVRYTSAGAPDPGFGAGGFVSVSGTGISAPALKSNGDIVVAGAPYGDSPFHGFIDQFNPDGSPDTAFGVNGQIVTGLGQVSEVNTLQSVTVQANGDIIAGGISHDLATNLEAWTSVRVFGAATSLTLDPASDTGVSNSDQLTDVATPTFDVPAYPGLYERVYRNGVLVSSAYAAGGTVKLSAVQPAGTNTYSMTFVDAAGNESAVAATDSITIDLSAPSAGSFVAPASTLAATAPHNFTITYSDDTAINGATLGNNNILVTGPNGYSQLASFVSATPTGNGSPVTATYTAVAPTGGWGSASANGTYTATLQANQVSDTAGNVVATGSLGTFAIANPSTGGLTGSAAAAAPSYNFTTLGTADWAHWGRGGTYGNFDHKTTGGSQISNVTVVGTGANFGGYSDSSRNVTWTDGTPTGSDSNEHGYIWSNGAMNTGYSFTAPADTTTRTLTIYAGGININSSLTAHLSDGSAADVVLTAGQSGLYTNVYTITYKAASAGQTLKITLLKTGNIVGTTGSVDLIGAYLH